MTRLFGLILAAVGAAHFVAPEKFHELTRVAFPDNVEEATLQNGAIETAVGLAVASERTRRVGFLGLAVYVTWLGYNAAANQ